METTMEQCERCGNETATYIGAMRDDGSRYEKKDGTIASQDDLRLCVDCLDHWIEHGDEF